MSYHSIRKEEWDKVLEQLILSYTVFATLSNEFGQDYELLKPPDIPLILYNKPKPATSLKSFFLPVKENVTAARETEKPRIILGIPNCDIEGLSLLDEIYLDKDYNDIFFSDRRNQTLLISSDCFSTQEHCHCMTYDIKPYSTRTADLSVVQMNGSIILRSITSKGEEFVKKIPGIEAVTDNSILASIDKKQKETEAMLIKSDKVLPDYQNTGRLINSANADIWKKYSEDCVSCGACTTICPTCTCFLLIDKPGFEKIKQLDACQYPGFERVAGGEDALFELPHRFRNRYMCKYLWKAKKFNSAACTGCGRCIEACIGKINKNELFRELAKQA
jgi:sulfhydrogenase subunit beta (sulfur reductase)